jgi:putative flippase GtrA
MGVDLFSYLPARVRTPTVEKLFKYSVASGSGVVTDAVVLVLCAELLGFSFMTSHLIAVAVSSMPNYLINRYWTWQQQGKNRLWGEVVPFWVMALLGFLLSTLFVAYVKEQTWGTTFTVLLANLSGFGVLWILKFLILDKVMWKVVHDLHPEVEIDTADAALAGALDEAATRRAGARPAGVAGNGESPEPSDARPGSPAGADGGEAGGAEGADQAVRSADPPPQ